MSRIDLLRPLALAGAVLCVVPACGGDDDDDVSVVDSGPGGDGSGACPVADALGSFDPLDGPSALHFTQDADPAVRFLSVAGNVSDSRVDLLLIELWDGFGAFDGGEIEAGTFELAGPETAVVTCGVCVRLLANVVRDGAGNLLVEKQYIATGGSITVDSIGTRAGNDITGNYSGSVSDLTLSEIDTDSQDGSALAGGCESGIDSVTWDAVIENGDDG